MATGASDSGIEAAAGRLLRLVASRRGLASLVLLALTALAYWPGHLRLPPVDRTEVVYAESSREMLREGRLIDPRYAGERERHRPIGTFWLQMASAKLLGPTAQDRIATYRLPSLISATLAVLATYWLLQPVVGGIAAFLAAAFAGLSPIVALESQLAITEGIALGFAVVAQLALLRLYVAPPGEPTTRLALLLWGSLGLSITLNALAVPILVGASLLGLAALDRWMPVAGAAAPDAAGQAIGHRIGWSRLQAGWGVPLMLALGAAWPVCLVLAEGGWPYHGLSTREILGAIGGSQAMKFKAPPLSFTLAFVAGSLPFLLLLWPALRRLWVERARPVERVLLASIGGYLAYLELISSKPALYTVPVLMPAAAAAVALCLAPGRERQVGLPPGFRGWPGWIAVVGWPVLVVALHRLTETPLAPAAIAATGLIALLLALATWAATTRRVSVWVVSTLTGFALFLGYTFGFLLPGLDKGWATERIIEAVEPLRACAKGPVVVAGYREPSAVFAFGAGNVTTRLPEVAQGGRGTPGAPALAIIETRSATSPLAHVPHTPLACVEAVNFTRGCSQSFVVEALGPLAGDCKADPRFACGGERKPVRNLPPCR